MSKVALPIRPPTGTEVWSDEFDDASIDPAWSRIDSCTASHGDWKEGYGWVGFSHSSGTSGVSNTGHWLVTPLPAGATHPFTVEYYVRMMQSNQANYSMQLTAYSDSNTVASGTQHMMMGHSSIGQGADIVGNRHWTGWNAQTSYANMGQYVYQPAGYYLRQRWASANSFRIEVSTDGITWLGSSAFALTLTPTHFAIGCTNYNNAVRFQTTYRYVRMYDTYPPVRSSDTL